MKKTPGATPQEIPVAEIFEEAHETNFRSSLKSIPGGIAEGYLEIFNGPIIDHFPLRHKETQLGCKFKNPTVDKQEREDSPCHVVCPRCLIQRLRHSAAFLNTNNNKQTRVQTLDCNSKYTFRRNNSQHNRF